MKEVFRKGMMLHVSGWTLSCSAVQGSMPGQDVPVYSFLPPALSAGVCIFVAMH